jgi:hypothetical protein
MRSVFKNSYLIKVSAIDKVAVDLKTILYLDYTTHTLEFAT